MKIQLPSQPFKYISENSAECGSECAFILTEQNKKYLQNAKENNAHSIVDIKELKSVFGLDRIKIVGITGTNGKTTTASAIYSLFLDLGHKCALQGTRGFFINDETIEEKSLTTPTALNTYRHIYQAVQAGCEYFIMEVSSHAIVQNRIEGIDFALKILTNITQDHLDFHKSLDEYISVKNSFFADESLKLINKDEPRAHYNFKNTYTYSLENPSSFKLIAYTLNDGLSGAISHFGDLQSFISPLYGIFNLYNLLAAIGAVKLLSDHTLEEICQEVDNFAGVSGRMQRVSEEPLVIVDFAHTPDGMAQVLNALREKEIVLVFGAGGDRDALKRPLMGKVAVANAKKVVITSDNPRNEDPQMIVDNILEGIENAQQMLKDKTLHVELNRKEAIKKALELREDDEILLILGKGDETYQIIYDKYYHFDDREVVQELLEAQDAAE